MSSSDPNETPSAPQSGRSAFHRVLLKLSGEALMGDREFGIDPATVAQIAEEIIGVQAMGVEVGIVIGAGNIYRGMAAAAEGMDRATGDYAGVPVATSRRAASSSLRQAPATRSSPPTRPHRCARWRSVPRQS